MTLETLLDARQVADILHIHLKKVQRLARTGVLPCIKIGAVYRFEQEALKGWIANEVSARQSEKEDTQGRKPGLGVSVQGPNVYNTAKDTKGFGASFRGIGEGGFTDVDFYSERPGRNE